jgi:hypothetical protein
MTTVVRLGNPLEGSACVQGDIAVVHEPLPPEVYALQPALRDMPMSTALSDRSPLQSISGVSMGTPRPRRGLICRPGVNERRESHRAGSSARPGLRTAGIGRVAVASASAERSAG